MTFERPGSQHPPNEEPSPGGDMTPAEIRFWLEFGCWTTLVWAPFLYWVNGPAVSEDQFVVRTGLVAIAAVGAVGVRVYALVRRGRKAKSESAKREKAQ